MTERMKNIIILTHLKLMRGAVPGRGMRPSAASTPRSWRRPDGCATSLSPRPPPTPSLTSSLIYAAERGRKKARQTDGPTLQHRWLAFLLFRPLVFAGLSLPSVSIPFQRLGMLRRVDGLAEEQCGDSLPLSKSWSRESPQSKSHYLSCRVLSILPHYSAGLGRRLVPMFRRTWSLRSPH